MKSHEALGAIDRQVSTRGVGSGLGNSPLTRILAGEGPRRRCSCRVCVWLLEVGDVGEGPFVT